MNKLESPGSNLAFNKTFTVTPKGIMLSKGEQIGMFEMGSTIVLLFESPKQYKILKQPGDSLKMGERITVWLKFELIKENFQI